MSEIAGLSLALPTLTALANTRWWFAFAPVRSSLCSSELGTSDQAVPLGVIIGGVLGGAVAVGGLILLALFKTGRFKSQKRGGSPSPAAVAGGSAAYPTIPQNPPSLQYPIKGRYPEPI